MSLKSLITETVLIDSMYDIESELLNIKEALLEQMIIAIIICSNKASLIFSSSDSMSYIESINTVSVINDFKLIF